MALGCFCCLPSCQYEASASDVEIIVGPTQRLGAGEEDGRRYNLRMGERLVTLSICL